MLYHAYYEKLAATLENVINRQGEAMERAAALVARVIQNDGMLYVFGCGHSHIIGEELFYRASGFAPVCAMLDTALMLHDGAVKSSMLERTPGIARAVFERYRPSPKDAMLIASQSGINAVPVEMAQCARENGVPVIAITSGAYAHDAPRTADGARLCECADIVIDNGVGHGDGCIPLQEAGSTVGPLSTISACMIVQCIMVQVAEILQNAGVKPPVYVSGNIPGGMEANQALIEKYRERIRQL